MAKYPTSSLLILSRLLSKNVCLARKVSLIIADYNNNTNTNVANSELLPYAWCCKSMCLCKCRCNNPKRLILLLVAQKRA